MKLSEWRDKFKNIVSTLLLVDSWTLHNPVEVGEVTGMVAPISDLTMRADVGIIMGTFTQTLIAKYRTNTSSVFDGLPTENYEKILSVVAHYLVSAPATIDESIDEISLKSSSLEIEEETDTLTSSDREWTVTIIWGFIVSLVIDAELPQNQIPTPFDINSIGLRIYNDNDTNLDYEHTIE